MTRGWSLFKKKKKSPNQSEPSSPTPKSQAKSTTPSNLERQDSNVIFQQNFYHIQTTRRPRGLPIILTLHYITYLKTQSNKHTNHHQSSKKREEHYTNQKERN